MTEFINYNFEDNETFINTFDESPLWSATFGLFLLKHLDIKPNQTVIDIGSGAGFPLMELAVEWETLAKYMALILGEMLIKEPNKKLKTTVIAMLKS